MSEDVDSGVVVQDPVVAQLAKHLQEQGRLQGITIPDLRSRLNRVISRKWGSTGVMTFTDQSGAGWFVDISEAVDDEMLYIVVRAYNGARHAVDVVESDQVEEFYKSGSLKTSGSKQDQQQNVEQPVTSEVVPDKKTSPEPKPYESPNDPVLIVYWYEAYRDKRQDGDYSEDKYLRGIRAEIPGMIQSLIQQGIEQKDIEVWTSCRRPKLEISLD